MDEKKGRIVLAIHYSAQTGKPYLGADPVIAVKSMPPFLMGNKTPKSQSKSVFDADGQNISNNATASSKSMRLAAQKRQELCV